MSSKPKTYLLLGCPCCGSVPEMERWHGGGPQKRMISCRDCEFSVSISAPTARAAVQKWNGRKRAGIHQLMLVAEEPDHPMGRQWRRDAREMAKRWPLVQCKDEGMEK
jgi:hypothetical protein